MAPFLHHFQMMKKGKTDEKRRNKLCLSSFRLALVFGGFNTFFMFTLLIPFNLFEELDGASCFR